jgi:hypothetical protein
MFIDKLFYPVIIIQLILFYKGLSKRKNIIASFSIISVFLTLIILSLIEFKVHHYLRSNYSIPNTVVYAASMTVILIFVIYFKDFIKNNNFKLLITGGVLWGVSVITDLLTDARLITIPFNDYLETLLIIAGTLFLMFFYFSILLKTFSSSDQVKYEK